MNSPVETKVRSGVSGAMFAPMVAGLLAAAICAGLYWREARPIESTLREREASRLALFDQVFRHRLKETADDLRVLADGDGLHAYLASGKPDDLNRAIRRAAFLSREQPDYDHLRYLDQDGQEILRVNQGAAVVPRGELKNEAARPYFQKAITLNRDEIYISAFDLNSENGRLEEPYQPALRFATPVFDDSGKHRGAYVINYQGSNLIAGFQQLVPEQFRNRFRLLNAQGFWIKAAQPDAE